MNKEEFSEKFFNMKKQLMIENGELKGNYDCSCKHKGKTYDCKNEMCINCRVASAIMEDIANELIKKGDIEKLLKLLLM